MKLVSEDGVRRDGVEREEQSCSICSQLRCVCVCVSMCLTQEAVCCQPKVLDLHYDL